MRGKSVRLALLPVILAGGLGACANSGVQPGYVNNTSYGTSTASASGYGTPTGESGRVVAINDTSIRGGGGGSGNGPMVGGLLGGLGGMAIGASGGRGIGGGLIGGLIGGIAGAIGGTIFDRQAPGRGIEVVIQKDDGRTVTVAQRDDGDVQLGDRVQVVQDRGGVAKVVRDNSRQPDYQNNPPAQNYAPAPQDYRQAGGSSGGGYGNYGPPPQDYRQSGSYGSSPQDYGSAPQPAEYGQRPGYARPQSTSRTGYGGSSSGGYSQTGGYQNGPQPQNDPRYGNLE